MNIKHYEKVDQDKITIEKEKVLLEDHRYQLLIPFKNRKRTKTLCVIGQNPSCADDKTADKTICYLEKYVYEKMTDVGQIMMLNLYSLIDTKKVRVEQIDNEKNEKWLLEQIGKHHDFLIVFGQLKNKKAFRFREAAKMLHPVLQGKHLLKIDIGTLYAPHPGNPKLLYSNINVGLNAYEFLDIIKSSH